MTSFLYQMKNVIEHLNFIFLILIFQEKTIGLCLRYEEELLIRQDIYWQGLLILDSLMTMLVSLNKTINKCQSLSTRYLMRPSILKLRNDILLRCTTWHYYGFADIGYISCYSLMHNHFMFPFDMCPRVAIIIDNIYETLMINYCLGEIYSALFTL